MKRLLNVTKNLLATLLCASLLVGCVSPMNQYQQFIEENDVEDLLDDLKDEAEELEEIFVDAGFNEMGEYLNDVDLYDSVDELLDMMDFSDIEDKAETVVDIAEEIEAIMETIEIDDEEVTKLNEELLESVAVYKEMGELAIELMDNINFLYVEAYGLYSASIVIKEETNEAESDLSSDYTNDLQANMDSLAQIGEALECVDGFEDIVSHEVDLELLENNKQIILDILPVIEGLETSNESDKIYNQGLVDIIGVGLDIIELYMDIMELPNYDIISGEKDVEKFIAEISENAIEYAEDWEDDFKDIE